MLSMQKEKLGLMFFVDSAIIHGHVHADRLQFFYFQPDTQTLRSSIPSRPKVRRNKVHSIIALTAPALLSHATLHALCFTEGSAAIQEETRTQAIKSVNNSLLSSGTSTFGSHFLCVDICWSTTPMISLLHYPLSWIFLLPCLVMSTCHSFTRMFSLLLCPVLSTRQSFSPYGYLIHQSFTPTISLPALKSWTLHYP